MSLRYKGARISATPPTTTGGESGVASGAWTLEQQLQAQGAGNWPVPATGPYIEDVFSTWLYAGNNGSQTIVNGVDLATKGGLVWIKDRTQAASHYLQDTARGANNFLSTNNTNAEASLALNTVFNTDGFSQNNSFGGFNGSGDNYVSWTFRKQPKFFDIVTYTGNGVAGRTIAHNLGSVPGCIIVKATSNAAEGLVYHKDLGNTKYLVLFSAAGGANAADTWSSAWNDTSPTSTNFTVGNGSNANADGWTFVAYLFAHDAGGFGLTGTDNVISCGSYTGNASATGPVIDLGYEPQFVIIKRASNAADWVMHDNMRGISETSYAQLRPNTSEAEYTGTPVGLSLLPTGFQIRTSGTNYNASGNTYIYIAIRRGPMRIPTDATKVFQPVISTSSGGVASNTSVLSYADWSLGKGKSSPYAFQMSSRLQGEVWMQTSNTSAESSDSNYNWAKQNYITFAWGASASDIITYGLRRAPSFFDVVCYTGDGTADGRTIAHNLGATPQLVIVKKRSSVSDWVVMFNTDHAVLLNSTNADTGYSDATGNYANGILIGTNATTLTQYSGASGNNACNASGSTYVAYLFATCANVSKVGSYTGNGSTQTINCGFAGGARFVLIKRTDSNGDWYVYDTTRGMTTLTDPYLRLNSAAAESATLGSVTTVTTGFAVNASILAAINTNAASYIFLAIA
jgi:hypothetical protein